MLSASNGDALYLNIKLESWGEKKKGQQERKGKKARKMKKKRKGWKLRVPDKTKSHIHLVLPLHGFMSRSGQVSVVVDLIETWVPGVQGTCWARSSHAADFHPAPCVLSGVIILHQRSRDARAALAPLPLTITVFFFHQVAIFRSHQQLSKDGRWPEVKTLFRRQICIWHCTLFLVCIQAESLTQQNMGKVLVWIICLHW